MRAWYDIAPKKMETQQGKNGDESRAVMNHVVLQVVRHTTPLAYVRLVIPTLTRDLWRAEGEIFYGTIRTHKQLQIVVVTFAAWKRNATPRLRRCVNSWMSKRKAKVVADERHVLLF